MLKEIYSMHQRAHVPCHTLYLHTHERQMQNRCIFVHSTYFHNFRVHYTHHFIHPFGSLLSVPVSVSESCCYCWHYFAIRKFTSTSSSVRTESPHVSIYFILFSTIKSTRIQRKCKSKLNQTKPQKSQAELHIL